MQYLDMRLKNYRPIHNGLGIDEIYIDFSKAKHSTIVLIGDNGSGKSTIMDALSPLPDDNSKFIEGLQAEKELNIRYNDIVYNIRFIHGVNAYGKRETSKGYISRIYVDGNSEELNPNGNITSFREILYEELELDPNFIALSHLSSVKKGIGQMTGSERKMFVNNIIKELVVYNNMYKVFSKRSNSFKSIINNILSKMNSIGDEEKLRLSLVSIENRINSLMESKDKYIEDLASHKSRIKLLDPNGDIQNTFNTIHNSLDIVNDKFKKIDDKIKDMIVSNLNLDRDISVNELIKHNNDITERYNNLEVSTRVEESSILNILNNRERESKDIQEKVAKLDSMRLSMEFDDIDSIIEKETISLNNLKEQIISMGLLGSDITKDEYIMGIETLNGIKDMISVFKSDCEYHIIQTIGYNIVNGIKLPDISVYDKEIEKVNNLIQDDSITYANYMSMKDTLSVLNDRPNNCMIDNCPFIENALVNKSTMDKIDIESISINIENNKKRLEMLKEEKETTNVLIRYTNLFNNIIRDIRIHANILKKLPIDSDRYIDTSRLVSLILDGHDFREIDVLYSNIQRADIIDLYKQSNERLAKYQGERDIYHEKISMINILAEDIASLNVKLDEINSKLEDSNLLIANNKAELSKLNALKMCMNNIFGMITERDRIENEKASLLSSFNNIKDNMIDIKVSLDAINLCNGNLDSINSQITPLLSDRDKIKFGISQLEQYKIELQEFNNNYERVETFKKYSSPSKDGIQNLFIELYMHQTLKLTNDILSLLFDGEFVVGDFVLNEKEFSIPVFGNGFPHDDVSSMSNAQVSMIQMIISFVLLHQSSYKYNIVKLDELDSMLDTKNRLQFVFVLEKVIEILGIEQVFIISHNNEINLQESSIILLKYSQEMDDNYDIIYKAA